MASYNELRKKMQEAANVNDSYSSEPEGTVIPNVAPVNTAATSAPKVPEVAPINGATGNKSAADSLAGQKDSTIAFLMYTNLCGVLCQLDRDVLLHNHKLIEGNMFEDDRYVPLESIIFISQHIAEMVAMLTVDFDGFRALCSDALNAEIMTDDMTAEQKLEYRSKTMDEHLVEPRDTFKMGLSTPDANTYLKLTDLARADMSKVVNNKKLMDAMEAASKAMINDDRMICSVILSNDIYMLRVFSKNALFLNQVSSMIDAFRAEYGIK
jgi:hypothetical protein